MSTTSVNPAATTGTPLTGVVSGNGSDMSNMFTTLLVAQIKNQDPLAPTDPSQFVNQLAQLSQVQAMQQLVSQGQYGNGALNRLQMMALGAQVGSVVRADVSQLQLAADPVTLHLALDGDSASNTLILTGQDGVSHAVALGALRTGDRVVKVDPQALGLAPGSYRLLVQDANHQALGVAAEAALTGVRLAGDGSVYAQLQGVGEVASDAITHLQGRPAAVSSSTPL